MVPFIYHVDDNGDCLIQYNATTTPDYVAFDRAILRSKFVRYG